MSQATPNGVNNAVTADPEKKKEEESGGILDGIFGSKPDKAAAGATANQAEGGDNGVETEKEKKNES